MFHRVLGADIACHCGQYRHQNDEVTEKPPPHIASQKADRTFERIAWHRHDGVCSPVLRRSHAAGSALLGGHEATGACVATQLILPL